MKLLECKQAILETLFNQNPRLATFRHCDAVRNSMQGYIHREQLCQSKVCKEQQKTNPSKLDALKPVIGARWNLPCIGCPGNILKHPRNIPRGKKTGGLNARPSTCKRMDFHPNHGMSWSRLALCHFCEHLSWRVGGEFRNPAGKNALKPSSINRFPMFLIQIHKHPHSPTKELNTSNFQLTTVALSVGSTYQILS